uniref:Putative e3 ubiquitin-protein ligase mdm2 n=1 Tax=Culex tarsalis TaxID=7177 RepID=A0A1Q3G363_CULTA
MSSCDVKAMGWSAKKHRNSEQKVSEIYITLAKESPIRVLESDEDIYNSLNEQETDICHDSSDTSDCESESHYSSTSQISHDGTITTMQVLEYEVASATQSENESSDGTSSGTDDYVLAAFAQAVADNSSASEFAILADTEEESDDQSWDNDFTPADYWKCVKCKNKQNNPMYRYCEKCYQVRKSLFPPRPKLRRKLPSKDEDLSDSSTSSSSSLDLVLPHPESNFRLGSSVVPTHPNKNQTQNNGRKVAIKGMEFLPKKGGVCSIKSPIKQDKSSSHFANNFEYNKSRKRRVSSCVTNNARVNKKRCDESSMKIQQEGVKNLHFELLKDSGFSSCSSQERTPTEEENLQFCDVSSQEIVLDVKQMVKKDKSVRTDSETLRANSQPIYLSPEAVLESDGLLPNLHESRSEGLLESQSSDLSEKLANSENSLGYCIFCLSEPKNSVFVHSNFVHLCCCYKCAVKVWKQRKSCPICNCKIKNVMKLFVH